MKKIIFFAAVISTLSITSCTKDNSIKPTSTTDTKIADDGNKNDVGQADIAPGK